MTNRDDHDPDADVVRRAMKTLEDADARRTPPFARMTEPRGSAVRRRPWLAPLIAFVSTGVLAMAVLSVGVLHVEKSAPESARAPVMPARWSFPSRDPEPLKFLLDAPRTALAARTEPPR